MNRLDSSTKRRTWKYLSERERYAIELLLKEGYKPKQIAKTLQRDRRTIEREIKRETICKRIENRYVSRNPTVPDYLEKLFYSAKQVQKHAEHMKLWKGRDLKMKGDKELLKHLEKRIADDKFSADAAIGENQHTPTLASGYVVLIRWLQSALIPFVTTQSVGVLNPPHE